MEKLFRDGGRDARSGHLFLCLVWFNVTETALCGAYCASTVVAMLALMGYRRGEYTFHSAQV